MVDAPGLVNVEPDDAPDIGSLHSVEQARDLDRPASWPTAVSVIRTGLVVNVRTVLIVLPKMRWNVLWLVS